MAHLKALSLPFTFGLVALALLIGCSEEDDIALFSKEDCKKVVTPFCETIVQSDDVAKAAALTGTPFSYRATTWGKPEVVKERLKARWSEIRTALVEKADEMEITSWQDLMAGRFPRGREVAEEDRTAEAGRLGVEPDGFYVRAFKGRQLGVILIVNPGPNRDRLLIRGIIP